MGVKLKNKLCSCQLFTKLTQLLLLQAITTHFLKASGLLLIFYCISIHRQVHKSVHNNGMLHSAHLCSSCSNYPHLIGTSHVVLQATSLSKNSKKISNQKQTVLPCPLTVCAILVKILLSIFSSPIPLCHFTISICCVQFNLI